MNYDQFLNNHQSGKIGPAPGRFELSEGSLALACAIWSGIRNPQLEVLRIELMRTDRAFTVWYMNIYMGIRL